MLEVSFHEIDPDRTLKYVVIQAKYKGQWVFVRHKERTTWEMVGGHIEEGETPYGAALRELNEESGAVSFELYNICDYAVSREGVPTYGRLLYAELFDMEELRYEIEEVTFRDELPENMTYPDIQPKLHERIVEFIKTL